MLKLFESPMISSMAIPAQPAGAPGGAGRRPVPLDELTRELKRIFPKPCNAVCAGHSTAERRPKAVFRSNPLDPCPDGISDLAPSGPARPRQGSGDGRPAPCHRGRQSRHRICLRNPRRFGPRRRAQPGQRSLKACPPQARFQARRGRAVPAGRAQAPVVCIPNIPCIPPF